VTENYRSRAKAERDRSLLLARALGAEPREHEPRLFERILQARSNLGLAGPVGQRLPSERAQKLVAHLHVAVSEREVTTRYSFELARERLAAFRRQIMHERAQQSHLPVRRPPQPPTDRP
jgi:hypothetical protein